MDEMDFSEDTTYKQQEDLPYDGVFFHLKICDDDNFTSKNDILGASDQVISTDDPQEKAAHNETCQNTAVAMTWDKMSENDVDKKCDEEQWYTLTSQMPADKRSSSKSNISDILLHHLSKEQFLRGQGIDCETLPEIPNVDMNSCYVKNSWSEEQISEFMDQLNPDTDGENKLGCFPSSSDLEEPMAVGNSNHQGNSNSLTQIKGPSDKHKGCQGQAPQGQLLEKASSSNVFRCDQGQVHYQRPDFSKIAPKVKMPKNNLTNKPLTTVKQAAFSPKLRNKSSIVQDIVENMSWSSCLERQQPEQKGKITETSQQTQMEPTVHIHQELLAGRVAETNFLKLTSASQKDSFSSSSSIFHKISQGKRMCQKLKEQTDQLKTKVQEFSKRIQQNSPCHLQDKRLEDLDGMLRKQDRAEVVAPSPGCAFCCQLLEWMQKIGKKGHKRINCGKFSIIIHENTPYQDSYLGSGTGPSFSSSGTEMHSDKSEDCGTNAQDSPRVYRKEPLREFHYKYDAPEQNNLNHRRDAFVQSCSSDECKYSSPSCTKPKWICSQRMNFQSFQDEREPTLGRKNLKMLMTCSSDPVTSPPPFQSCRISGSKSLCDLNAIKESESKIVNSALDHALKTATILKKTTDQMIKAIAEDLAKAHRWRNRLKF